jgi:hypothetical protein
MAGIAIRLGHILQSKSICEVCNLDPTNYKDFGLNLPYVPPKRENA